MNNEESNSTENPVDIEQPESIQTEEVIVEEGIDDLKAQMPSELDTLKLRAAQMEIKFHPKIGLDKLKKKIADFQKEAEKTNVKLAREAAKQKELEEATLVTTDTGINTNKVESETKGQRRARLVKEASRLVRVRVSNMNPNKKEWEGDIFTVSNSVVGTFKKYVPYNNEEGWHVPQIILTHLLERQCQIFYTVKNNRGAKVRKGKLIKELNIEVLPDLTYPELKELAQRQAQANSID